jgi:hypothetical protein
MEACGCSPLPVEISMSIYEETARQWVDEIERQGKCTYTGQEERERVIREYARCLEEIFHQEVSMQLGESGKAQDFERMLLYDTQYINKFLNQAIPAFPSFRTEVFNKAKKMILGD